MASRKNTSPDGCTDMMPPLLLVERSLRRRGSVSRPKLVADAGMDSHILFTRMGLDRLKRRISELVQENKAERNNFKVRQEFIYQLPFGGV